MKRPTRAALYLRLSKDSEASSSIERQRQACQRLADARGWEVVMVEEDVDVSATRRRLDRPGLDRIRAAYGALDAVVYWKTDRLARSLLDYASLVEEAEAADVALVSATEPLDLSSPMGRAMAQVVAIFAELEARTIGLRMESTIRHLREVGRAPGGRLPYGFTRVPNPDGPGFVVAADPDTAPVVKEVVERVLSGDPMLGIARDLTERGVPTPKGGEVWNPTTLHRLLRNPSLIGRTIHRGEVMRGEDGLPLAHRPALVDPGDWRRLQEVLDRRARPGERRKAGTTLLLGLAVCGRCGERLYSQPRKDRRRDGTGVRSDKVRFYYACSMSGRGHACPGVTISLPRLDAFVEAAFLERHGDDPVLPWPSDPAGGDDGRAAEVEAVREALADLERDRYERGLFSGEEGAARFADLHARLSSRLHGLQVPVEEERVVVEPEGEPIREVWASGDTATRRDLLGLFLERVRVLPTGLARGGSFDPARIDLQWLSERAPV